MTYKELITDYLQECYDDGVKKNQIVYLLSGFVKALSAQNDDGDLYKKSQDKVWLGSQIEESGLKFR
jgi:hypothetical protein